MTEEEYLEIGRFIWNTYVPKSGQSETVQGELLRAIVKLQDEAQRNGNGNWDHGHETLANYIRNTLIGSEDLSEDEIQQLNMDIEIILDYETPYTEDDVFDRVEKIILGWCLRNKEPVPRAINPDLHR